MGSTLIVDNIEGATTAANVKMPAGSIVQMQHLVNTTANAASTSSNYPQASGFKLSITPKFATSKILVMFDIDSWIDGGNNSNKIGKYGIRLNSQSNTLVADKRVGFNDDGGANNNSSLDCGNQVMLIHLDTPGNTNPQEYELMLGRWASNYDNNVKINGGGFGHSTVTLLEIAQ